MVADRKKLRRRIFLFSGLGLVLTLVAVTLFAWGYLNSVDNQVRRVDAFGPTPDVSRPAVVSASAQNVLIMGIDSGSTEEDAVDRTRADSIILAHLPADRSSAQFISIPRDTWLPIPSRDDGAGGMDAKVNSAYALGQTPLMVRTIESFTGVRVDHTITIDFDGFEKVVDALGGVEVTVDTNFTSVHPPYRTFTAGRTHMDGPTALDFARQRKQFPDGDFTRMRHQREIISAVFEGASRLSVLDGPAKLDGVIRSAAEAVIIDETLSLMDIVGLLRQLRATNLAMLTSPSAGTGMVGDQSVVFADLPAARELYDAVRTDRMAGWLASHEAT